MHEADNAFFHIDLFRVWPNPDTYWWKDNITRLRERRNPNPGLPLNDQILELCDGIERLWEERERRLHNEIEPHLRLLSPGEDA